MKIDFKYIIALAITLLSTTLMAQEDWELPSGEIEDAEVVIEKSKEITLPMAARRFGTIPLETVERPNESFSYQIVDPDFELEKVIFKVRPKTVKQEALQKFYAGTVNLGFGNYITPYIKADLATKRSDEYAFNINARHLSSVNGPVDGSNSGAGQSNVGLGGKLFFNNATLSGSLGYQRDTYHYYGYDQTQVVLADDIAQSLNHIAAGVSIANNNVKNLFDYDLGVKAHIFSTKNGISENEYAASLHVDNDITDNIKLNTKLTANFMMPGSGEASSFFYKRNLMGVKPIVSYREGLFGAALGVGVFHENENNPTLAVGSKWYVLPHVKGSLNLEGGHQLFAQVSGEVEKQSIRDLYRQNNYMHSIHDVRNNIAPIKAHFGFEGNLNKQVGYAIGYQYSLYSRLGFFMNNQTNDTTQFITVYDEGKVHVQNYYARLSLNNNTKYGLSLNAEGFSYQTVTITEPWHKPKFKATLYAYYLFMDKLRINTGLNVMTGIKALEPSSLESVVLNPIIDLNLKIDYSITPRASVFLKSWNVLGKEYEVYLNYPVKGFQVLGGISYSF